MREITDVLLNSIKCEVADCFVAIHSDIQKALNGDASKLHRLKYYYFRPTPRDQGQISAYVYILLCECVFLCWTPTVACISSVNVCFHAGLPQSLYILLC